MDEAPERSGWPSILIVWAIALAGSIAVLAIQWADGSGLAGVHRIGAFGALGVVLAVSVLAGLLVQLATRRPPGFVGRVSTSLGGSVGITALAALAVLPSVLAANA